MAVQDRESDVRGFMEDGNFDLPVLLDSSGSIAGQYGVTAVPTTVFIDAQGRIAELKVGQVSEADLEGALDALR